MTLIGMQTQSRCATTLPNLVIIGSAKSGTTSLYHYLDCHPEISMAAPRESERLRDNDAGGLHGPTVHGLRPALLHYHSAADEDGFLLRPRCSLAEPAADRVNRSRAAALDLAYGRLRRWPVGGRARRMIERLR